MTTDQRVAAVLWTYNRYEVVEDCIAAVLSQTFAPSVVVVADSNSPDRTGARLEAHADDRVRVLTMPENLGPGAAIADALAVVAGLDVDLVWLVEDDSRPGPSCLESLVSAIGGQSRPAMVGPDGAKLRRGQWRLQPRLSNGLHRAVDFVYMDGALLDAAAVALVAPPRKDYFIMLIDVEYPMRLAAAGVSMTQLGVDFDALRLGAAANSDWRAYYQTRNHLHLALSRRSPALLAGFAVRTAKHVAVAVRTRSWFRLYLRLKGIADALRGRMGRTLVVQ